MITTATGTRNGTGFTLTITGYVTDREITQAIFTFNGTGWAPTSLTVALDSLFVGYFGGSQSSGAGGQFVLTQPFAISGNAQAVTSVTVTLVNGVGSSSAVTVALN